MDSHRHRQLTAPLEVNLNQQLPSLRPATFVAEEKLNATKHNHVETVPEWEQHARTLHLPEGKACHHHPSS